jgi:glutaredoxin-related protein
MKCIENAIQAAVIEWVHIQYPCVLITTTNNEGHYKNTRQIGSLGIPDLILFHKHYVLFLEIKTIKGKLRQTQKDWFAKFSLPHSAVVAYGFDQAKEKIISWMQNNS